MSLNNTSKTQQIDDFKIICEFIAKINRNETEEKQKNAVKQALSNTDPSVIYQLSVALIPLDVLINLVGPLLHKHLFKDVVSDPTPADTASVSSSTISLDDDLWDAIRARPNGRSWGEETDADSITYIKNSTEKIAVVERRHTQSSASIPEKPTPLRNPPNTFANILSGNTPCDSFPPLGLPEPKFKKDMPKSPAPQPTKKSKDPALAIPEIYTRIDFSNLVDPYDPRTDEKKITLDQAIAMGKPDIRGYVNRIKGHEYPTNHYPGAGKIGSEEWLFGLHFYPKSVHFYMTDFVGFKPGDTLPGWHKDRYDWQTSRRGAKSRHKCNHDNPRNIYWEHQILVGERWISASYPEYRNFMRNNLFLYRIQKAKDEKNANRSYGRNYR